MKAQIFTALLCDLLTVASLPLAPPAPIRPVTDDYFGTKIVDNYRWMEDLEAPEMQRWMKAQADYTRAALDALPGHAALVKRMHELADSQPEEVEGLQIVAGRYYTLRTPAGAQSPKLYVRNGARGTDRLLIDPDRPSADHSHISIHSFRPSWDGRYVAYDLAAGGSEESVLHIYDVQEGHDLSEVADRADDKAPFWRADGKSFFYSRHQILGADLPPTAKYQRARVYLHVIGRPFEHDAALVGMGVSDANIALQPDEYPAIYTARGSPYAILTISPGTEPRLRVYAAPLAEVTDGNTKWRSIAANYDDEYSVGRDIAGGVSALTSDTLYWLSRKAAPRGQILKLNLSRPDSTAEVAVPETNLPISAVYAGGHAIYWRVSDAGRDALQQLEIEPGAKPRAVHLPYAADVFGVQTDAGGSDFALWAASWLRSPALLTPDPATHLLIDSGLQPAGPYDHPDDLLVEEVKVKSWDGTEVPLSIIRGKRVTRSGENMAVLLGYGAYGANMSAFFSPTFRTLFDRGAILATAHVRGGGEYGEAWHKAGFQATKSNTWKDYIACAQYLVDRGYTAPAKLVGFGQSAGGIMIGRAIEERPDLFAVAIIRVPLTDTLRFETTANGPGNVPEFGSVKTKQGFQSLYAMSAYAHVSNDTKYPATLIYAGANDQRVAAWIPAKFAARLQAASSSGRPVLLRVDYDAGHTGFDATREQTALAEADQLSFALWQTGDPEFQPPSNRR